MLATVAVAAVAVAAGVVALGGLGGGSPDTEPGERPRTTPRPSPSPRDGSGGRPGRAPDEVIRFKRRLHRRCIDAGPVAAISATADPKARREQMLEERRDLKSLRKRLAGVPAPGRRLQRLMKKYLRRLAAQIRLNKRIARAAGARDEYSIEVGMSQNDRNRDARNTVVKRAGLSRCLRARQPR